MFEAEKLLANPDDVVIVAARSAWPEYNELHAYVCQANRTFQQVSRMGFYSKGVIYPLVPKILEVYEEVPMVSGSYSGPLGKLVDRLVNESLRVEDARFKVILLSPPDSPDTLKLAAPIPNNQRSKTGKPTAFTMGQRYASSQQLLAAKLTSDLS